MKARRSAAVAATTLALGLGFAGAAQAAPNNANQDGLVNLALQDTVVQVPVGIAANICGVTANVLAASNVTSPVDCTAEGVAMAHRDGGGDGNNARQRGLVNVAVQDTTVQVPIAVAANVCGVTVNAISSLNLVGPTTCDALAEAGAQN
ncbi:hypothetical protein [Actinotalea sp. Marseille-Q4924]|uniref:hypothetical protein n=1 Tax=Actinotalea sp. Marseille-Q4924 TaxID=2866571 RepID=UPI001CE3FBC8|nr:hypothetical protein [Actinotalea sp. Marseille-Q4924]